MELSNVGGRPIDLTGVFFDTGIKFAFDKKSPVRFLVPGQSVAVVADREAYLHRFGDEAVIAGAFWGNKRLSNGGEAVSIAAPGGDPIFSVKYDDKKPWPKEADGEGFALEFTPPGNGAKPSPANWRPRKVSPNLESSLWQKVEPLPAMDKVKTLLDYSCVPKASSRNFSSILRQKRRSISADI